MTDNALSAFVTATTRYMKTAEGTANMLFVLKKGGTVEGAIAACVAKATKLERFETVMEVVSEIEMQETAKAVGYMKVGA